MNEFCSRMGPMVISDDPSAVGRQKCYVDPLRRHRRKVKQARKLVKALDLKVSRQEFLALVHEAPG